MGSRFAAVLANTRHWAGWKVRRVFGFRNWRTGKSRQSGQSFWKQKLAPSPQLAQKVTSENLLSSTDGDNKTEEKCKSRLPLLLLFQSTSLYLNIKSRQLFPQPATESRLSPPFANGGGTPNRSLYQVFATSLSHPTSLTAGGLLYLLSSTATAIIS